MSEPPHSALLRGLNQSMTDASFSFAMPKRDEERRQKQRREPEKTAEDRCETTLSSRESSDTGSSCCSLHRRRLGHGFDAAAFQDLLFPSSRRKPAGHASSKRGDFHVRSHAFAGRRPSVISSYHPDMKYTFYHNDCRLKLEDQLKALALAKAVLSSHCDSGVGSGSGSDGNGNSNRDDGLDEAPDRGTAPRELCILELMQKSAYWLDIQDTDGSELRDLGSIFNLHPLTLEDILEGSGREKCKVFAERSYVYFCLHSPTSLPGDDLHEEKPTHVILHSLGSLYFILFRDGALTLHTSASRHRSLPFVLERLGRSEDGLTSPEWILYATLDVLADFMFPLARALERDADHIELMVSQSYQSSLSSSHPPSERLSMDDCTAFRASVAAGLPSVESSAEHRAERKAAAKAEWGLFAKTSSNVIARITRARASLTSLSRTIGPRISSLRVFLKRREWLSPTTRLYFQDPEETLGSLSSNLEYVGENLSRSYDSHLVHLNIHLSAAGFATNTTVKRLTVAAGIFLPLTLIVNIFGMSVAVPGEPDTDWSQYTEWFVIVGALILLAILFVWISKRLELI